MENRNIYKENYLLTTNYYDRDANLSIQGILDLCQTIAGRHQTLLGGGRFEISKCSLVWVVARTEIEYFSYPPFIDAVDVYTWPLAPARFYFDRHYKIVNPKTQELIVYSRSRWVLIDLDTRTMARADSFTYPLEDYHKGEGPFGRSFPRAATSETPIAKYKVRPSDIDENGHFNNTKYGNLIYDYLQLKEGQKIKHLKINYNCEALCGDELTITRTKEGNKVVISGYKNEKIVFSSESIVE